MLSKHQQSVLFLFPFSNKKNLHCKKKRLVLKKMDFSSRSESQRECLNNNSNIFCNKKHYMKNVDGQFFIVNTCDFFYICRHHCAMVECSCDIECPEDIECTLHFKLNKLEQYTEFARDKNLNFNKAIKKIVFVFEKDFAQSQEAFWWSHIIEWEWADVPPNATISWGSFYL